MIVAKPATHDAARYPSIFSTMAVRAAAHLSRRPGIRRYSLPETSTGRSP
jgi:hypothetical protein